MSSRHRPPAPFSPFPPSPFPLPLLPFLRPPPRRDSALRPDPESPGSGGGRVSAPGCNFRPCGCACCEKNNIEIPRISGRERAGSEPADAFHEKKNIYRARTGGRYLQGRSVRAVLGQLSGHSLFGFGLLGVGMIPPLLIPARQPRSQPLAGAKANSTVRFICTARNSDSAALPRHSSAESLCQSDSKGKRELHPDFGRGFKLGLCSPWKRFGAQRGSPLKWIHKEPSQAAQVLACKDTI